MSGVNELFFRFHEKLANAFRGYGAFVARHTLGVFACGFIFFFCISFGIYAASKETELDKLWVETGSRITPEKDFYESKFGGLTRQQPVALVAVGSDQVITKANLDAWRAILIPMLTEDESNPYNAALASVSSPLQTNVKFFDSGKTAKLTQKVFCERPPIPPLYFSDAVFQGAFGRSYNVSGYCTNAACGYAALVRCLNRQASFFFASDLVLGFGWGLDRFPCTRTVALDCFTEGDFDYPLAMKQLDRVAWRVLLASTQTTGTLATAYASCINEAVATYSIPPAVLPSTGLTAVQAGQLPTILRLSVQAFGSFGYWWRQSYRSLTDDAALTTYMNTAIENGLNPGITSTDCFTQSLTQGLPNKGRECCVNWSGTKVGEQLYGGGITYGTGKLSATRLVANNWHQDHPTLKIQLAAAFRAAGMSTDLPNTIDRKALVEQYEAVWQNYLQPFWRRDSGTGFAAGENNSNLRLYFAMWRATDDTIREGSEAEAPLLIGAHILLIGYICLCLSKLSWPCSGVNAVYSHVGLAIWAVITEIGSVVASFGVMGIINVKLSPIALSLIPFLSLGIGIDDMLVLGHTLMIHNKSNDVLNRMKEVLGVCCPAILQTTMANITAFFIASITPIRVVQSFSIHMGFAILLNFIALLVIFVPVMAWDIQRTMAKRTDFYVAPCIVIDGNIPNENDPSISEGGNIVTNITKTYVSPVLQMWWVKVLVLCAIYAYTAAMAWNGAVNTQKGLKLSDIALRGSFVREYTDVQEKYFGSYASFLVTKDIDYKNQGFQSRLLYTLHQLDKSKWRSLAMRVVDLSWFATSSSRFLGYGTSAGFNTGLATPLDPLAFDVVFAGWITTLGITSAPDIYCESLRTGLQVDCTSYQPGNTTIKASRHTMYNHNLFTNEDTIAAMADNRYAADSGLAPGEGYMFGFIYQFYQQYVNIDSNLYKVVGWSLLGVFGTTLLFTFSPIAAGIMCLVILQIVVQLWGMCRIIDVKLNAFSVVNLCFSVGIAVEFTSYVTHAFLVAKGNRNQRMAYAVEEMMAPMFNGAVSTFLAVVVLVGAKFPFFRIYYFAMFSLMVALALINGMFCLPILLSLVGPPSMHGENDDNSKDIGMQRLDTHDTQSTANLAV